jgi:hypothetical protein
MAMRRLASLTVCLLGCKPELPELEYFGERVAVGSDVVDQVCEGTLRRMDREVEQIEARLDLPIQESHLDVYVVDRDVIDAYCSGVAANCTKFPWQRAPRVLVDQRYFDQAVAHELVHARLATSWSVPLFNEGIAEAITTPSCPRTTRDLDTAKMLAVKKSADLAAVKSAYYIAGELVAWLLDEFGPGEVLNFMRSTGERASSSKIKAKYRGRFGGKLEADLVAHIRTDLDLDALSPEDFGCLAPGDNPANGPVHLLAELDCDSERVHNNFAVEGSGYVEWTLLLDEAQTLELVGEVPSGTSLTIEECGCISKPGDDVYLLARPVSDVETLGAGAYRLRWTGDLEGWHSINVALVPL